MEFSHIVVLLNPFLDQLNNTFSFTKDSFKHFFKTDEVLADNKVWGGSEIILGQVTLF